MPESFLDRMPYLKQEFKIQYENQNASLEDYEELDECSEENLNTVNLLDDPKSRKRKSHVRIKKYLTFYSCKCRR